MMFEHLSPYSVVLVTGPQRSGTTLVARAIAYDTGLRYVDEDEFSATDAEQWWQVVRDAKRQVIQCPGMSHLVDRPGIADQDDIAVVMVYRPVPEIVASQERVNWQYEAIERANYEFAIGPIAQVKYVYWCCMQRPRIKHAFDVNYHDLENHPLWVPEAERRNGRWGPRAWRL